MQTARFADLTLSRLMLGTVQFGMPYGIANTQGRPDYAAVRGMLAAAAAAGVNALDTAAAYGASEEVLGRALADLGLADRMVVVTKVRALTPADSATPEAASRAVRASVEQSLRRLRLEALPVVLFHRESDAVFLDALLDLKRRGLVRHVGVSCDYRPGVAERLAAGGRAEALQVQASLLDRRHLRSGLPAAAAARGVALFIRSVYLQGLLLMPAERVPPALAAVLPVRARLAALAAGAQMGLPELALRYVLGQPGVTCVLAGVETIAQVQENIRVVCRGPLPADLAHAVEAAVPDLPDAILSPALWPKAGPPPAAAAAPAAEGRTV